MISQWYESKEEAIRLRKKGTSMIVVEKELGVPKSTLSGWFKGIVLSKKHTKKLSQNKLRALVKARKKSAVWHREQKENRLLLAKNEALKVLSKIDYNNSILEIALAILYMGEGRKTLDATNLGSSDPMILRFYLEALKKLYNIDLKRIRCALFLRADQDEAKVKRFWARELGLSVGHFIKTQKDKRTVGSKTFSHYRGVCSIYYGDVGIQRRLLFLAKMFCEKSLGR